MSDVRRKRISLLLERRKKPKVLVSTWGIRSVRVFARVSAEERNCLEGVYAVRSSERGRE